MHNGSKTYRFRDGVPNQVTITDAPWNFEESVRDIAIYAQDQWTLRNMTMTMGVRFNDAKAWTPEQVLGAGFFVPERRFAPVDDVPHYRNLSPRLGVAYDVFGTGRTALKASIGHYPDRVITAEGNPVTNLTRNTSRNWNDANRNFNPDCDLLNPAANGECGAWSNLNFGKSQAETLFADDARTGFNSQLHNWQGAVSLQHELRPGLGVNVGYYRTWYGGFTVTENMAVTAADFDTFCVTAPVDSRLPNSGQQVCGFYDIKPAAFGLVRNQVTQASNFGKQTQIYNGVDATINMRFATEGLLSGGLSVGRSVSDTCYLSDQPSITPTALPNSVGLPAASTISTDPAFCNNTPPWSQGTQVKFMAVYPLPWGIQTSAIYQNSAGVPITATYTATNAQIAPSLGRNLGSCRGAATCNGNLAVELLPYNSEFEPRLQQIDLRFSRLFRLVGNSRLRAGLDIYNVLNASNVLSMNTTYGSGWQDVRQILGGRLMRVGAQFDF
jgi:hypothetical protein